MFHNSIAIITARGGSKRIPRKNIKSFCGNPMIARSIEAALESGWGKSDLATQKNNLAGLAVAGIYLEFDDPADSIEYLARLIETDYSEDGAYYGGSTDVTGISVHYNPDHAKDWAEAVQEIMDGITRRIDENE